MPEWPASPASPTPLGPRGAERSGPARLSVSFWAVVTIGIAMIIWSAVLLVFIGGGDSNTVFEVGLGGARRGRQ